MLMKRHPVKPVSKRVQVLLTDTLDKRLRNKAAITRTSRQEVIKKILNAYFRELDRLRDVAQQITGDTPRE